MVKAIVSIQNVGKFRALISKKWKCYKNYTWCHVTNQFIKNRFSFTVEKCSIYLTAKAKSIWTCSVALWRFPLATVIRMWWKRLKNNWKKSGTQQWFTWIQRTLNMRRSWQENCRETWKSCILLILARKQMTWRSSSLECQRAIMKCCRCKMDIMACHLEQWD